jgi:hypothetical protein
VILFKKRGIESTISVFKIPLLNSAPVTRLALLDCYVSCTDELYEAPLGNLEESRKVAVGGHAIVYI